MSKTRPRSASSSPASSSASSRRRSPNARSSSSTSNRCTNTSARAGPCGRLANSSSASANARPASPEAARWAICCRRLLRTASSSCTGVSRKLWAMKSAARSGAPRRFARAAASSSSAAAPASAPSVESATCRARTSGSLARAARRAWSARLAMGSILAYTTDPTMGWENRTVRSSSTTRRRSSCATPRAVSRSFVSEISRSAPTEERPIADTISKSVPTSPACEPTRSPIAIWTESGSGSEPAGVSVPFARRARASSSA